MKKEMLKRATDNESVICNWDDIDNILYIIYQFKEKFDLSFEASSLNYCVAISVYVPNLIGGLGYNILLNEDVDCMFEDAEDFIFRMLALEEEAKKVLFYFKNKDES